MNPFRKPLVILVGAVLVAALSTAPAAAGVLYDNFGYEEFVADGRKWGPGPIGTGATVTWSLMPTGAGCGTEFFGCTVTAFADFMPAGFLAEVQAAFDAWQAVADITFTLVADDGADLDAPTTSGDIRIGGHAFDGPSGVLAHGYYPPPNGNTQAGDIHFDITENWTLGQGLGGFDLFQVMAHEIGHAIGLKHHTDVQALMNPYYTEDFRGLLQDDIDGAVYIYGEREGEPVPEPGTILLIGSGLIAFVLRRRRG